VKVIDSRITPLNRSRAILTGAKSYTAVNTLPPFSWGCYSIKGKVLSAVGIFWNYGFSDGIF